MVETLPEQSGKMKAAEGFGNLGIIKENFVEKDGRVLSTIDEMRFSVFSYASDSLRTPSIFFSTLVNCL